MGPVCKTGPKCGMQWHLQELICDIDDSLEYSTQVLHGIMRMHMPYEICYPFVIRDGTVNSEIFERVAVG